jgi:hypothetical protein
MTIGIFYICLLVIGLTYAVISGVFGWLADLGDGDIHVDASGHMDAGHSHPISGTTVGTFVTGFGAGGVVAHYGFGWTLGPGLGLAVGTGVVVAGAAYGVLELIFSQTQAGSEFGTDAVVGRPAEVIVSIPEGGSGEVTYVVKSQREQSPARASDGRAIPRGRVVVIEKVLGSTVYVRAKD